MEIIRENVKHIPILPELIRDGLENLFYENPLPKWKQHLFVITGIGGMQAIHDHTREVYGRGDH